MIPASNLMIIAAGLVAIAAFAIFLNAILAARWAQRAAYYGVRRDAQRSANRRLTLAISTLVVAVALFLASWFMPREMAQSPPALASTPARVAVVATMPSPTPEITAAPALSPAPTLTFSTSPTATASPLDSPIETPTPTPTPTPETLAVKATQIPEPTSSLISPLATPTDAVTSTTQSPLASPTQVPPNKRLVLNAIASGIDANGAPIDAGTTFTAGVETIYVFFDFRDVPPSALLRHSWFRDGGSVFFRSKRLTQNGAGTDHVSWSPTGGFRPGLYEVRIMLGGVPQFVANFEVR